LSAAAAAQVPNRTDVPGTHPGNSNSGVVQPGTGARRAAPR
jgi:hypothetical protein